MRKPKLLQNTHFQIDETNVMFVFIYIDLFQSYSYICDHWACKNIPVCQGRTSPFIVAKWPLKDSLATF